MTDEPRKKPFTPKPPLSQEVGAKAARKLRARRHVTRTVWFGLGMMGLIGWSVAIPTLLGAIFFGGLGWTVRRGLASRRPAFWFLGSLLLRMSILMAGFYVVSGGRWDRLLACLLGFVIARQIATRLIGPPAEPHASPAKEPGHAS